LIEGLTDQLVTRLEPVWLVCTIRGSPIFTIALERVKDEVFALLLLLFLQAGILAANRQINKKLLVIVFIILFLGLTSTRAPALPAYC
jgi:hypothetical protein